ncbi:MAG: hypothetical protein LC650_02385 [Actinobacteria bacterium]|nr:hypothetical protein [Actinomycetota bacterium]
MKQAYEAVRFDLYYNGNKHDAGILAKLNDTGIYRNEELYHELERILSVLNYKLPVPNYWELGEDNEAFFTPKGYSFFGPYMERLAELIARQGNGWEARERREIVEAARIQYEDDYQIVAAITNEPSGVTKLEEEIS